MDLVKRQSRSHLRKKKTLAEALSPAASPLPKRMNRMDLAEVLERRQQVKMIKNSHDFKAQQIESQKTGQQDSQNSTLE